ncbi:MAG TPA: hypothetical protein VGJ20_33205, partial [Xanthobacteraceae bacterium]
FAAPLGAHGLCPALLALFHDHLLGSLAASVLRSRVSPQKFESQPREPVAKVAFRAKDDLERVASLSRN